jgi:hypothetical protein
MAWQTYVARVFSGLIGVRSIDVDLVRIVKLAGWCSLVLSAASPETAHAQRSRSREQIGVACIRRAPDFSPDDTTLCFASPATSHGDIYRANRGGTGCVSLTETDDIDSQPLFSQDGTKIAFVRAVSQALFITFG